MNKTDETEKWEESLDKDVKDGDLKFPATFTLDDDISDLLDIKENLDAPPPKIRKKEAKEIDLGKKGKRGKDKKNLF